MLSKTRKVGVARASSTLWGKGERNYRNSCASSSETCNVHPEFRSGPSRVLLVATDVICGLFVFSLPLELQALVLLIPVKTNLMISLDISRSFVMDLEFTVRITRQLGSCGSGAAKLKPRLCVRGCRCCGRHGTFTPAPIVR